MSRNAMAGAVTLCGIELCTIGGALLAQSGGQAHAAGGVVPAATMMAGAANAQAGPRVVWYGVGADTTQYGGTIGSSSTARVNRLYWAWSDGTIELKRVQFSPGGDAAGTEACGKFQPCSSPWIVISSPTQGFKAIADINADELVNGADLASVLGNWGDAPRVPFPPSDGPLNLLIP